MLRGLVCDEKKEPVPFASVVVQNASDSIIGYAYTGNDGKFKISVPNIPNLTLSVRCLGYKIHSQSVVSVDNLLKIVLIDEVHHLPEITIRPDYFGVREKGEDTLVYSPQYFSTGAEQNIGDLLRRMPGFEVNESGTIRYQNRQVGTILVDGQDILGDNYGMFINNLSADFAYEIELQKKYDDGDVASHYLHELNDFKNNQLALNLKRKNAKNRWNLNASGAYGYRNKYKTSNTFVYLNKFSLSGLIVANNTGSQMLSIEDFFRFNASISSRMDSRNTINLASGQMVMLEGMSGVESALYYIPDNEYSRYQEGLHLNFTFNKPKRYRGVMTVIYQHANTKSEDQTTYNYFYDAPVPEDSIIDKTRTQTHVLSWSMRNSWFVSEATTIKANTILSYYRSDQQVNNRSLQFLQVDNNNVEQAARVQQDLVVNHRVGAGLLYLTLNLGYNHNRQKDRYNYNHSVAPLSLDSLWYEKNIEHISNAKGVLGIHYPFLNKKIQLQAELVAQNKIYWRDIEQQSNDLTEKLYRTNLSAYTGINFSRLAGLLSISLGTNSNYNYVYTNFQNIPTRSFFTHEPMANMSFYINNKTVITLRTSFSQSDKRVNELLRQSTIQAYNSIRLPSTINNTKEKQISYNFYYSYADLYKRINIYSYLRYEEEYNNARLHYYTGDSFNYYHYENGDKERVYSAHVALDKGIAYVPLKIKTKPHYDFRIYSYLVTNQHDSLYTPTIRLSNLYVPFTFLSTFQTMFNFEIDNSNSFNVQNNSNTKMTYRTHSHDVSLKLIVKKRAFSAFVCGYWQGMFGDKNTIHLYDFDCNLTYKYRKWIFVIEGENLLHLKGYKWFEQFVSTTQIARTLYRRHSGYVVASIKYHF